MAFTMRLHHMLPHDCVAVLSSRLAEAAVSRPCFLRFCFAHEKSHLLVTPTHRKYSKHFTNRKVKESVCQQRLSHKFSLCGLWHCNLPRAPRILSSTSSDCPAFLKHDLGSTVHTEALSCTRSHFAQRGYRTAAAPLFPSGSERVLLSQTSHIDLDLDSRLAPRNVDDLRKNLSARGSDFDLDQLLADHKHWKELNEQKTRLERERTDIAKSMASLVKGKVSEDKAAEKEKLTGRGKAIKEEMKDLMPQWSNAEQKMMEQALRLPSDLHPLTPRGEDQLAEVWKGSMGDAGANSHVQFAERIGLLKFSNVGPRAVYLLGEAAEMEQTLLHGATACLRAKGHTPVASPEIFRSLVVEGCGLDTEETLGLQGKEEERETNAYHLKGNSLLSYAAFLTKVQVKQEHLPLRMCSVGRHYRPQTGEGQPGLYGPVQSNRVSMFGACVGGEEATVLHDDMVTAAWEVVRHLGLPAREMSMSAGKLAPSESRRTEVQIWAPGLQQYVTMAFVSTHDDYVSRRLMSKASNGDLLHVVSGVAMDTAVVLASILEHSYTQDGFRLRSVPDWKDGSMGRSS